MPGTMREPPVHYADDGAVRRDHPAVGRLGYEVILGIVLGRTTYEGGPDEVRGHVFGLTLLNDVSTRNIQAREMTGGLKPSTAARFACVAGPMRVDAWIRAGLASGPDYRDSAIICMCYDSSRKSVRPGFGLLACVPTSDPTSPNRATEKSREEASVIALRRPTFLR